MNDDFDIPIRELIENSKKINSKTFNITRLIILTLLLHYRDGLQFRELKTFFGNITDGKLQSNLNFLLEMKFIKSFEEKLDNRAIQIYMIEDLGKAELKKILKWVDILKAVEEMKNGK